MGSILALKMEECEALSLAAVLADEYSIIPCPDLAGAEALCGSEQPGAILYDLDLSRLEEGIAELARLSRGEGKPPILVLAGPGVEPHIVVLALRHGAADFIGKPIKIEELKSALRALTAQPRLPPYIGSSEAARRIAGQLREFAHHDYPILILGESGTGKELAAKAIHFYSGKPPESFVPRNCAAIPPNLIESELFGTSRGAFTDALERPGAFELADGGTLFLDEIGDAALSVQATLLRVLESGEVWRLGARKARKIKVRLVSATSIQLSEAVQKKEFRQDLFYRINTLVLNLPPLRERREDIPEIANYFARKAAGPRKHFSECALERLANEDWPGNVRELRNVVHRAIVLSGDREEIGEEYIVIY
jgi:DNA-binding NtrC family response regulator